MEFCQNQTTEKLNHEGHEEKLKNKNAEYNYNKLN
jgi:hypothetical protein